MSSPDGISKLNYFKMVEFEITDGLTAGGRTIKKGTNFERGWPCAMRSKIRL